MFGGYVDTPDGIREPSGDTWAYDPSANTWTELGPSGPPSARAATAMAYDPATRRVIMFGGVAKGRWLTQFDDTWAYDPVANTWAQLSPAGPAPVGRSGHVMVYDPPSGRILMFGGGGEREGTSSMTSGLSTQPRTRGPSSYPRELCLRGAPNRPWPTIRSRAG